MTTYNTGNAIGSTDARDLLDNAQALDEAINSTSQTYTDRRGVQRRTLAGLEAEFPNAQANAVAAAAAAVAAADSAVDAANEAASAATAVGLAFNEATAAQASRVAAEAARDAAMLSAGVYATTAAGLVATISGQYFSVPSADSAEYLILYLNNAGAAVEQKRYPSAAAISAIQDAERASVEQPNLFTKGQLEFTTLPTYYSASIARELINGLATGGVVSDTVNGIARAYWRFPASAFPSGKISAQLTIESATAGNAGQIQVTQRASDGVTPVKTDVVATGLTSAITSPKTFSSSGVTLHASAAFVDFDIQLTDSAAKNRKFNVRSMMVADGVVSGFRQPPVVMPTIPTIPPVSIFPNPALTSTGAATFLGGATILENGEQVLNFSGAGSTPIVAYNVPAVGVYAPGSTLKFTANAYCNVAGNSVSADLTIICLDASGVAISGAVVASVTTAGSYNDITATRLIPANTATVQFRFVKRPEATSAKFRRVVVTSDSSLVIIQSQQTSGASSNSSQTSIPSVNVFPNPSLTSAGMAFNLGGTTTFEDSDPVLNFSGAGFDRQSAYDVPATGIYTVGTTLTLKLQAYCDVAGNSVSADVAIICLDSAGVQIGENSQANVSVAGSYNDLTVTRLIPANTATVRFRFVKRSPAALAKFRRVVMTSDSPLVVIQSQQTNASPLPVVYVSPSGADAYNGGAINAPVKTLAYAMAKIASRGGRIIMRAGDYSAGASVAGIPSVSITAYKGERVRFILGTKLTGITKTAGYTKVYQAALAAKPPKWVWEHDTPDARTLISAADRHPLQRGRQHRLPSTHLDEVASIAAIDAASTPSWYWSGGILYFSAADGGDATLKEYRVPNIVDASGISGGTGIEAVKAENISVWYGGSFGLDARNLASWEANNCAAFCGQLMGFGRDETRNAIERLCESAGNVIDGFNAHRYATNPTHEQVTSMCFDNWAHDNGDDGDSLHEDCLGTYYGGLYEYNGDRGIATAFGAHSVAYGSVSRYNGQIDPSGGEGFAAVGAVDPAMDNGVGTQMDCYDCQSYGNRYNYSTGAADAHMNVVNSKSKNAGNTHFAALAGTIKLVDCGSSGTGTLKSGSVTVENTTLVV